LIVLVERLYGADEAADEATIAALDKLREEASKRGW
jgi:hypothetical protein